LSLDDFSLHVCEETFSHRWRQFNLAIEVLDLTLDYVSSHVGLATTRGCAAALLPQAVEVDLAALGELD
jgi:hypothetical protein